VKVNDDSTCSPDPCSPIIIDFPKLVYLSIKSNAPTAQHVVSPPRLHGLSLDFVHIGFMSIEGSNLTDALSESAGMFSQY
jgi:hypothetical protein